MQWNTCQDPGLFFCDVPRDTLLLLPVRDRLRDAAWAKEHLQFELLKVGLFGKLEPEVSNSLRGRGLACGGLFGSFGDFSKFHYRL